MSMNKIKQQIQEVLDSDTTNLKMELPIALGKSEDGTIYFRDLTSLKFNCTFSYVGTSSRYSFNYLNPTNDSV